MSVVPIPDLLAVEVTADDIRNGKRNDNCECPVALALKRLPGVEEVVVEIEYFQISYRLSGELYDCSYRLPQEAADFITAFDFNQPVGPVEFGAELEEWS